MIRPAANIGLQRTSACGLAAEAGSFGVVGTGMGKVSSRRLIVAMILLTLGVSSRTSHADHFPEELVAAGSADTVLARIHVTTGPAPQELSTVIKHWGVPLHYREIPETTAPVRGGEAEYSWRSNGIDIKVGTMWHFDDDGRRIEAVVSASIEGESSVVPVSSARGICLGDPMSAVRARYGERFVHDHPNSGEELRYQFKDETVVEFGFNDKGLVNRISLVASVE